MNPWINATGDPIQTPPTAPVAMVNGPSGFNGLELTPISAIQPRPTIVSNPTNLSVLVGNAAAFYVEASGDAPLTYQWRKGGANIPNETNTSYAIPSTVAADAGNYDVVVTNGLGYSVNSAAASLTVLVPVSITNQPAQQVVSLGGTATFSVGADGFPAPNYQWTFKGNYLTNQTGTSLVVSDVNTIKLGDYAAIAWNSFSAATSSVAKLLMYPSIYTPFAGETAIWGKPATLFVVALGSGPLTYQWYKDGTAITDATNSTLDFASVQVSDGGFYSVVVSSPLGSVTNTAAQLVVNPANISLGLYAGVTIDGVVGYTYGIQYSTNLSDPNSWTTITNLTLTQPAELWVDTSVDARAPGVARRLYRVMSP
jgi:hypothetical protein